MKVKAVKKLLEEELRFNKQELKDMDIQETMIAGKGDGIVYCAFSDTQTIREIHLRLAESRNEVLKTREYIPPQLFDRFKELNRACAEIRSLDPRIKDTDKIRRTGSRGLH